MPEKTKEQILSNYEWNGNIHMALRDYTILELEKLLETNSTQAYWPAIIKERINQLKGNNNG